MTEPDQPETPPLTRRQLRELRNTASTPIITPDVEAAAHAEAEARATEAPVEAPLPRPAVPPMLGEPPVADATVDLTIPALTRRQARQQERLRTASIPVIAPESADGAAAQPDVAEDADIVEDVVEPASDDDIDPDAAAEAAGETDESASDAVEDAVSKDIADANEQSTEPADEAEQAEDEAEQGEDEPVAEEAPAKPAPVALEVELPPSFDRLLSRQGNGASSSTNALILSQTPETSSLTSPVTATGEVIITGSFSLPDSYGSTGSVPGSAAGKDVDAVLVDGEIPAASSPTPIAASSAISTIKSAEDIIRPPAPEKGSRLMMALAITAGVLALALAGVLILAIATGVL